MFHAQDIEIADGGIAGRTCAASVLDETGLTGRYNFSVAWSGAAQEKMRGGEFDLNRVQKVLNGRGLELEPATEPMNVFVVGKTRADTAMYPRPDDFDIIPAK